MHVVMVGAGYVGLVSGACFAEFGANVVCVDVDARRVEALQQGRIPIYEPGLDELVVRNVQAGRLGFSTDLSQHVPQADLVFIAVGTPSRRGDGHADLSYVHAAAREIAGALAGYTVVVDKSTVPVGTARQVERIIREVNPQADFDVASNPEFLREGAAIKDFMHPDRVVLGVATPRAEALLRELYRPLNLIETPILVTDWESAELIKYAANAFLATKISFINEMSMLCESVGADVHAVAKGMGLDGRIGRKFLHPGPGYGGSCFPKDTLALIRIAQEHDTPCRIKYAANAFLATNAVLGLTFKPETDDMRDAPALSILPALLDKGAVVRAHDPQGMEEAKKYLPDTVRYYDDIYEMSEGVDAVVLLTEWNEYRGIDLERLLQRMRGRVFLDLRNVYEPTAMRALGFDYTGVGR
jgi:UDPglucose 6-dehydrogenase